MPTSQPIQCPVCLGRHITGHHDGAYRMSRFECESCFHVWKPGHVISARFSPADTTSPTVADSSVFRIIDE